MGIRIKHGGPKEFAELGAIAGKSEKAAREAETAERTATQLREHMMRRELAAQEIAVKQEMAQDAMAFEREKFNAQMQFNLQMELTRQAHDFETIERRRLEENEEIHTALKAIDGAEGFSPKEKKNMQALYLSNRGGGRLPAQALGFGPNQTGKDELAQGRVINNITRLQNEIQERVNFIGQFGQEVKGGMPITGWFGTKTATRGTGKNKRAATQVELDEAKIAEQEIPQLREQINRLNEQLNGMTSEEQPTEQPAVDRSVPQSRDEELEWLQQTQGRAAADPGMSPAQAAPQLDRAKEIASTIPRTESEANALLKELAAINPKAFMALRQQWSRLGLGQQGSVSKVDPVYNRGMLGP